MKERRNIEVIKNSRPKKSSRSSVVIKNGCLKKLPYSSTEIKNDHPKKLTHFQDQAMIPRMPKKTFKRQILRSRCKNTINLEEKSS